MLRDELGNLNKTLSDLIPRIEEEMILDPEFLTEVKQFRVIVGCKIEQMDLERSS